MPSSASSLVNSESSETDHWAEWLLKHRHGGDAEHHRIVLDAMRVIRDKVLEHAKLKPGETLLDVGTGDGLIGFGALERVGADGSVIFSDISQPLLDVCRQYAEQAGVVSQCQFVKAGAPDLSAIPDQSVDVVTTRSVIIYVKDKQRAFNEFFHVLKPGGRISLFEPIAKLAQEYIAKGHYLGYDIRPIRDLWEKIVATHQATHDSQSTMGDFDERDLVKMVQAAGFDFVHLGLDVTVGKAGLLSGDWERFYHSSPNPLVPTLRQQVEGALTDEEQQRFITHLKPLVEGNIGQTAQCLAYLMASKE